MHDRHVSTRTPTRRRRRWLVGSALMAGGLLAGFFALTTGAAVGRSGTEVVGTAGRSGSASPSSFTRIGYKDGKSARGLTEPTGTPTAHHFAGLSTVGALFGSASSTKHTCTASVIDSPNGNVILTAAHCIRGTGAGEVFVPGYDDGKEPYGAWTVTGSHGAPDWLDGVYRQRDYAFLTVESQTISGKLYNIQSVTGGLQLGNAPSSGEDVTIPAYASGNDDQPLTCTTSVYMYEGYPAFNCNPYPNGTSGAPWLYPTRHGDVVEAIIGGLHAGGCYTYTSYSSDFSVSTWDTYITAAMADSSSSFPSPGSDGCSD